MEMQLNTYIIFNGNCEEAIQYYKALFNGEITQFLRYSDAPEAAFKYPESAKNLVMHSTLIFNNCTLLASDAMEKDVKKGNNFSLSINTDDSTQAEVVFNSLAKDGTIIIPLKAAFWGGKFGMLSDKFGIQWLLTTNN